MNQIGLAVTTMAMIALVLGATGTTAGASVFDTYQGNTIQSDNALYPIERLGENVNFALAQNKTEFKAERAIERMREYEFTLLKEKENVSLRTESNELIAEIESDLETGELSVEERQAIGEQLKVHLTVMERTRERASEQSRTELNKAIENANRVMKATEKTK